MKRSFDLSGFTTAKISNFTSPHFLVTLFGHVIHLSRRVVEGVLCAMPLDYVSRMLKYF